MGMADFFPKHFMSSLCIFNRRSLFPSSLASSCKSLISSFRTMAQDVVSAFLLCYWIVISVCSEQGCKELKRRSNWSPSRPCGTYYTCSDEGDGVFVLKENQCRRGLFYDPGIICVFSFFMKIKSMNINNLWRKNRH